MDSLGQHDLELARQTSPAEKLAQALELMATGIRLKRAALKNQRPHDSNDEIERALTQWLASDG
jgi:hypothetical protein